ncbi:MAG: phage late control D family protein [Blastococcus sp.]
MTGPAGAAGSAVSAPAAAAGAAAGLASALVDPLGGPAGDLVGPATGRPTPAFALRVGGLPLPPEIAADVIGVSAAQDVDLPGMFTVRLIDWSPDRQATTWSNGPPFEPGAPVEVLLGYVGALTSVLTGEITGLELEIDGDQPPTLLVRGYDRRHRLMRGQLTRSFVGVTDSDIAHRIGTERGLAVRATATTGRVAHVFQHNQTDLEFLTQRARRIGYEVGIDDRTLLFQPRRRPQVATALLRRDVDLVSFAPRLTTMGQTGGVAVQGWDPSRPDRQLRAVTGADDAAASGRGPAAVRTAGALGVGNRTLVRPLADRAEAETLAGALAESTQPWRITGPGTCIGRPDVRAGSLVRIEGLGDRFSGDYAVTSATHTFSPSAGYRTDFCVERRYP